MFVFGYAMHGNSVGGGGTPHLWSSSPKKPRASSSSSSCFSFYSRQAACKAAQQRCLDRVRAALHHHHHHNLPTSSSSSSHQPHEAVIWLGDYSPVELDLLWQQLECGTTHIHSLVVHVSGANEHSIDFSAFFRAVARNAHIEQLALYYYNLSSVDAVTHHLHRCLASSTSLRRLSVRSASCRFPSLLVHAVVPSSSTSLTRLDLSECGLGKEGARQLSLALLHEKNTVQELVLQGNAMGNAGVAALASALRRNQHLAVLDLAHNDADCLAAAHLAQMLGDNQQLHTLSLRANRVGSSGAALLLYALQHSNVSLCVLDLTRNAAVQPPQLLLLDKIALRLSVNAHAARLILPLLQAASRNNKSCLGPIARLPRDLIRLLPSFLLP